MGIVRNENDFSTIGSITYFVRFTQRWRNLIIIPSFQCSEHALESYCHCASYSVYVIHLKRKQHYFNVKKTAAESHRILVEVYGEHANVPRVVCTI